MNLFNSLSSILGGSVSSNQSVLGVDVGSSSIKVVQLKKESGRAVLETYGEISLGGYGSTDIGRSTRLSPQIISTALKDLITESNVSAKKAGFAIPFSSSLTAVIEMPKMPEAQLSHMIPIEARKYIPASVSEVSLDWFLIPEAPKSDWSREKSAPAESDKQEVLLVAIHNESLAAFQSIAKESGLAVGFYELEIFSAVRASLTHGIAPILIIDIGAATTKIFVVERGIIRFSHSIPIGGQEMTLSISRSLSWNFDKSERVKKEQGLSGVDAEGAQVKAALLSTVGRVLSEIHRVLLSYEKKYNANVGRAILSGGGAGLRGIEEEAKSVLNIEIIKSKPFEKIQSPAFLKEVLEEVGPSFAVSVGAALRQMSD